MNSKSYIGYFSEIRDLEKSKQEELLELARYEAFTTLKLNGMSALYFVISLLSCFLFAIGSYWLFRNGCCYIFIYAKDTKWPPT